MNIEKSRPFRFKEFVIHQDKSKMKVGTDGVLLGAWADLTGAAKVLDIGTGSGLIAIMLAQRSPESLILGVDVDVESIEQAQENMAICRWAAQLEAVCISIQDFARNNREQYQLIVSNPPFFSGGTFSANQDRTSIRHTVKLPHGDLIQAVQKLLHPDGRFSVILPLIEGLRFQELARHSQLYCTRMQEVKGTANSPVERLLLEFEKKERPLQKEAVLVIQKERRNDWTEEYQALTGAFYLDI